MNTIHLIFRHVKKLLLIVFLSVISSNVNAKDNGCWAEFYDKSSYKGHSFRINGAAKLRNLRSVEGKDWDLRIASILVGPTAQVTVFENMNFKLTLTEMANHPDFMRSLGITEQDIKEDSELVFHPNSKIHTLGDFNFFHKIKSLTIECKGNQSPGFFSSDNGCWAEFYDKASYKGKSFRVDGAAKFKNLRDVEGGNWDLRIASIVVGPKAQVTVFENMDFKLTLTEMINHPDLMKSLGITEQDIKEDSEVIFHADLKIHTLGDFNFHHKIKSLKVDCVK